MAAILQLRNNTTIESLVTAEPFLETTNTTFNIGIDEFGSYITLIKLDGSNTGDLNLIGNITASSAIFSGNIDLEGNLFIGGSITLGSGSNDTIIVGAPLSGSLIPEIDATYDLGSPAKQWNKIYADTIDAINISGSIIVDWPNIINNPTLVSGSAQIDHNLTTNYVLNQHIDHSTLIITAGNGLSGGGTLVTSKTITLDTGSNHFTNGIKNKLDIDGVVSQSLLNSLTPSEITQLANIDSSTISSVQWGYVGNLNQDINSISNVTFNTGSFTGDLTINGDLVVLGAATEIKTSALKITDKLITVASGSINSATADGGGIEIDILSQANPSLVWEHASQTILLNYQVSSSIGFKGDGSQVTGVTAADIDYSNISNLPTLFSGSSQVIYPNIVSIPAGIVSGSSQIDASQTTNINNYLPLTVGTGSALTGTLYGNDAIFSGYIAALSGSSTEWNAGYAHSQLTSGNPHQVGYSDLTNIPVNVAHTDTDNNFSVPQSGQDAVNPNEFVTLQQISPQSTLIVSQRNISFGESYIANYRDTVINDGATYYPNSAGYEYAAIKQQNIYPSLLTIPSAEKLSKLYSILPPDRTGDFTVSRASIATRINSDGILVTEANDVIRFDYTNGFPEILVEGQSTNLALRSEEFDNVTAWNHIGSVSVTANNIISPDGNLTADKIISSTTLERHHLVRSFSNTTDLSATASFFVKEGGQKYVACSFLHASNSSGIGIIIDLTDGSLFSSSVSSSTYSYIFTSLINGWKYITFTITNPATHYPNNLNIGGFEDNSFTYNGNTIMPNYISDGIKGIYLYGAQIELGTSATSYIKTLGTTVTRVADVVTVTPPVGVTSIIETINNIDQAPITTIPGTYQIPNGRFNKIIML